MPFPNVLPYQILVGPADIYIAPVGTAFPVVNVAPAGAWVNVGKTEGGITARHTQSVELIRADQSTGPIKAVRSEEGLEFETNFAELTLENYARALNGATVTSAAGPPAIKTVKMYQGVTVNNFAFLARASSPYGNFNMQYQVPLVIQAEEPEVSFVKDDKSVLHVRYVAIEDPAAALPEDRFGSLVAQTA